ncbi:unnamed protein product, partial [Mesorhabditis belari]|uniref:Uncharacterized protein n=1 Tax=Mesorhabditis belari TaxID=2138241 RepID=A0AAF3EQI1_9BILA
MQTLHHLVCRCPILSRKTVHCHLVEWDVVFPIVQCIHVTTCCIVRVAISFFVNNVSKLHQISNATAHGDPVGNRG